MAKTKNGDLTASAGPGSLLAGALAAAGERPARRWPAPVHLWSPPDCGAIPMRIARDGSWHYQGGPIGRPAMVRLFAGLLKVEDGRHCLVTPVEKVWIEVEDAPFVAVDVEATPEGLTFETNFAERVTAGPGHALVLRGAGVPAIHVRDGLWARLDRKTFYRATDLGYAEEGGRPGLRSGEAFFPLDEGAEALAQPQG